jgi:hypothetical protein
MIKNIKKYLLIKKCQNLSKKVVGQLTNSVGSYKEGTIFFLVHGMFQHLNNAMLLHRKKQYEDALMILRKTLEDMYALRKLLKYDKEDFNRSNNYTAQFYLSNTIDYEKMYKELPLTEKNAFVIALFMDLSYELDDAKLNIYRQQFGFTKMIKNDPQIKELRQIYHELSQYSHPHHREHVYREFNFMRHKIKNNSFTMIIEIWLAFLSDTKNVISNQKTVAQINKLIDKYSRESSAKSESK